jgi:DNA-binding Xre family transcriptional regulator
MLITKIKKKLQAKGVKNAYQFMQETGIKQRTAYRLWQSPLALPSLKTLEILCRYYKFQPGELLEYDHRLDQDFDSEPDVEQGS